MPQCESPSLWSAPHTRLSVYLHVSVGRSLWTVPYRAPRLVFALPRSIHGSPGLLEVDSLRGGYDDGEGSDDHQGSVAEDRATRRQTADQVIRDALAAMTRDATRKLAAEQARALRDDPQDLAEIRAVREDLAALHEG